MDKRKLIFNTGLHKNLQSVSQSLEQTDSILSDKQTNPPATNMQGKIDFSCDGKLSNIESSKSLNNQSVAKNKSFIENEVNFCEIEKDVSRKKNLTIDNKLLKTKSSKQFNSQNTSATSQQHNDDHLSGINKLLHTANYPIGQKRKSACLSEEASDSDLDFSYNKYTAIKKKRNEIILDINLQHDAQDINLNDSSGTRLSLISKTYVKSINESSTSQKKQNIYEESLLPTELKKYRLTKNSEECGINNEENFSKKNFYIPVIFSNFLQKCGITILNDGTHILSKF